MHELNSDASSEELSRNRSFYRQTVNTIFLAGFIGLKQSQPKRIVFLTRGLVHSLKVIVRLNLNKQWCNHGYKASLDSQILACRTGVTFSAFFSQREASARRARSASYARGDELLPSRVTRAHPALVSVRLYNEKITLVLQATQRPAMHTQG